MRDQGRASIGTFGTEHTLEKSKLLTSRRAEHEAGTEDPVRAQLPHLAAICPPLSLSFLTRETASEFAATFTKLTEAPGRAARRRSVRASAFLRSNQPRGESLGAGRRRGARRPRAGGDRAGYLMALTGGFRRRISARQFRNRVYSAMSPSSRKSPPSPAARLRRVPPTPRGAGLARRGGRRANASRAPPPAASPPTCFSSGATPARLSAGAGALVVSAGS